MLGVAAAFILALTAFVLLGQVGLRRVLRYSLGTAQLEIRLFGRTLIRIPFDRILEIRKLPSANPLTDLVGVSVWRSGRATKLSMANRMVWKSALLIRRRGSLFGRILITPDDPDTYLQAFAAWRASGLAATSPVKA